MQASSSTVLLRFGLFLGPIQIQFEIQMTSIQILYYFGRGGQAHSNATARAPLRPEPARRLLRAYRTRRWVF